MSALRDHAAISQPSWASIHLNAIRGLAALVVVAGHERGLIFSSPTAALAGPPATDPALQASDAITIGHEAVMVFFVLSGYLVGGSVIKAMAGGRWKWSDYLLRRLTRLWTVLLPALLLGFCIDWTGSHVFAGGGGVYDAPAGQDYVWTRNFGEMWSGSIFLGNLLFVQTILTPLAGTNMALWSLCNEFWYYIVFPLFALATLGGVGLFSRLLAFLAGVALLAMTGPHTAFLFLVWLLGAGVALAPRKLGKNATKILAAAAPPALALTFILVKKHVGDVYLAEMTIGLVFAFALYAICHLEAPARPGVYAGVSGFLSNISYTLYLTHLPVLVFLSAAFNRPWRVHDVTALSLAQFCGTIACALLIAWLVYLPFEANTDRIRVRLAQRLGALRLIRAPAGGQA
jgi:peptidoglycan/LPS O-acetylase OafA/YrhL